MKNFDDKKNVKSSQLSSLRCKTAYDNNSYLQHFQKQPTMILFQAKTYLVTLLVYIGRFSRLICLKEEKLYNLH